MQQLTVLDVLKHYTTCSDLHRASQSASEQYKWYNWKRLPPRPCSRDGQDMPGLRPALITRNKKDSYEIGASLCVIAFSVFTALTATAEGFSAKEPDVRGASP